MLTLIFQHLLCVVGQHQLQVILVCFPRVVIQNDFQGPVFRRFPFLCGAGFQSPARQPVRQFLLIGLSATNQNVVYEVQIKLDALMHKTELPVRDPSAGHSDPVRISGFCIVFCYIEF